MGEMTVVWKAIDPEINRFVVRLIGELARDQFLQHLEVFAFSKALETAWSVVARIDKMISDAKPWDLAKDENQKQTLNAVLYRVPLLAVINRRKSRNNHFGIELFRE